MKRSASAERSDEAPEAKVRRVTSALLEDWERDPGVLYDELPDEIWNTIVRENMTLAEVTEMFKYLYSNLISRVGVVTDRAARYDADFHMWKRRIFERILVYDFEPPYPENRKPSPNLGIAERYAAILKRRPFDPDNKATWDLAELMYALASAVRRATMVAFIALMCPAGGHSMDVAYRNAFAELGVFGDGQDDSDANDALWVIKKPVFWAYETVTPFRGINDVLLLKNAPSQPPHLASRANWSLTTGQRTRFSVAYRPDVNDAVAATNVVKSLKTAYAAGKEANWFGMDETAEERAMAAINAARAAGDAIPLLRTLRAATAPAAIEKRLAAADSPMGVTFTLDDALLQPDGAAGVIRRAWSGRRQSQAADMDGRIAVETEYVVESDAVSLFTLVATDEVLMGNAYGGVKFGNSLALTAVDVEAFFRELGRGAVPRSAFDILVQAYHHSHFFSQAWQYREQRSQFLNFWNAVHRGLRFSMDKYESSPYVEAGPDGLDGNFGTRLRVHLPPAVEGFFPHHSLLVHGLHAALADAADVTDAHADALLDLLASDTGRKALYNVGLMVNLPRDNPDTLVVLKGPVSHDADESAW